MLSQLSVDLLRYILRYLTLSDIQSLDISMISHDLRPHYLSAIQGFEIPNLGNVACKSKLIEWLWKRQFLVQNLTVLEYELVTFNALILQNASTLINVHFLGESNAEDSIFLTLKQCPNLATLDLSNASLLTDQGIHNLVAQITPEMMISLKRLNLSNCSRLTSRSVNLISKHCPQLAELNLAGLDFIGDDEIEALTRGCRLLSRWDLSATSISDASVQKILETYSHLEMLVLCNCHGVSLGAKLMALRLVEQQLQSDLLSHQLLGLQGLSKAFSDEYSVPIDIVVNLGFLPRLVHFLSTESCPELQVETALAFATIASGNLTRNNLLIGAGVVPPLNNLLFSPNLDVVIQAARALGYIAAENHECRDELISAGTLNNLSSVDAVSLFIFPHDSIQEHISTLRALTWAITNFCEFPLPHHEDTRVALPFLLKMLTDLDEEVRSDACLALSTLTGDELVSLEVLELGFLDPIVNILATTEVSNLRISAIRVIGNLLSGDENQAQMVLNTPILSIFAGYLTNEDYRDCMKDILWSLSNVTCGDREQVQQVLESGILEVVMKVAATAPSDIQMEAVCCVTNVAGNGNVDETQIETMIELGAIEFLSHMAKEISPRHLRSVFEGLLHLLQNFPDSVQRVEMEVLQRIHYYTISDEVGLIDVAKELVSLIPDELRTQFSESPINHQHRVRTRTSGRSRLG